jgi:hypothetical protein
MTEPRKRTNAELWGAIERLSGEAELARIDGLDETELDRELRKAGIDPDEAAAVVQKAIAGVDASGAATAHAAHMGPAAPSAPRAPAPSASSPAPRASRPPAAPWGRARWVPYLATAAIVLLIVGALTRENRGTATPPSPEAAALLRTEASEACGQAQWKRCAEKLDEARLLDPDGEAEPRVTRLREAIRKASGTP